MPPTIADVSQSSATTVQPKRCRGSNGSASASRYEILRPVVPIAYLIEAPTTTSPSSRTSPPCGGNALSTEKSTSITPVARQGAALISEIPGSGEGLRLESAVPVRAQSSAATNLIEQNLRHSKIHT